MKRFYKKLIEVFRPFRWTMVAAFGFIALSQALGLVAPYLQGKVVDNLINNKSIGQIYLLIGATLAVSLIRSVALTYLREVYEIKKIDFSIPHHMSHKTIERLFDFSIGQHISENSGIKQSKINKGQHSLNTLAFMMLYEILPMIIEVVLLIGVLLYFSKVLGLIMLTGTVLYVGFVIYTNYHFRNDFEKMEDLFHQNSKFHGEVLRNIGLVIANAKESYAIKECDKSLSGVFDFAKNVWLSFVHWTAVRNLILVFTRFSILAIGVYLVYLGHHTVGQLVMFLSWSSEALGQVSNVGNLHRQIVQLHMSVKKYFEMMDIEPDIKVLPNPVRPAHFQGRIEFKEVTFKYKRRETLDSGEDADSDEEEDLNSSVEICPALRNVSFTIEAGQTVAFVGESGSGKTTIIHALIRAQDPDEGQIVVDGNDLRVLDLKRFREAVGIVDQQVSLFDHTLRYNMTYGLNEQSVQITDSDLDHIAEMSGISRFSQRLEKGYDTIIGERGVKLSGGERQRVGIARALIKNPDILIFDEATSNLDSENEALIRESIEKISRGRTTIIIAHRFSTIRNVEKIIVFSKGRVVGEGTHHKLALSCEPYCRLIKNQIID